MANKQFGVKEFTLIGSSGSPSLTSPNNINLNANTVAISTNATVGGNITVNNNLTSNDITVTNINVTGVTTIATLNATTIIGSGSTSNVRTNSLNVSGVSTFAGITTVTGSDLFTKRLNVSGVSTFSGAIKTNQSNIKLGDGSEVAGNQIKLGNGSGSLDAFGDSSDFWIYHNPSYGNLLQDLTGSGIVAQTYQFKVANPDNITQNAFYLNMNAGTELYYNFNKKLETLGAGITITGTTFTNQLNVSGVSTFNSSLKIVDSTFTRTDNPGSISFRTGEVVIDTASNTLRLQPSTTANDGSILFFSRLGSTGGSLRFRNSSILDFDLSGSINISGVSTLSSNVSVGGTISIDGGVKLVTNNPTIVGTSGTAGEIKRIGGAPFYYDGSAWREFVLSSGTPVSVPADTEWDNVVFRATFDDNFTDAKFGATPVYVSSGSTIVGAAVTIGTGAFRNDGAVGSGVSYAYRSDYDFTGSWTIEFWMYVDSGPVYATPIAPVSLVSMNSTTGIGTSGNWSLAQYRDQFGNVFIAWFNQNHPTYKYGYSLYGESGAAWSLTILDKWNHFALVRESDNGSLHLYVNGIERADTKLGNIFDNDILDIPGNGLHFGGDNTFTIGSLIFNSNATADVIFDDIRISCGVGTAGQRYTSIGISTYATFTPPTTALPTTGTLSSYVQPPGDKYGEITLGGSPTWRGTSGVTVSQQSSGNYRVSFASSYTNANDYYVLSQGMDQGFASYVGIARSTTHVDLSINRQSNDVAVDTGALAVQIKNHI